MRKYRVIVIGFAHSHVDHQEDSFNGLPNVEFVAAADTKPATPSISTAPHTRRWSLKRAKEEIGIPRIYDDYREMLEREEFDIALCCPENARHGEVTEAVAAQGGHVITEKPMAASNAEAVRMAEAAKAAGTLLAVNWPSTWAPQIRRMEELLDEGAIGRVFQVKNRSGGMGTRKELSIPERQAEWWYQEAQGGGAFLDYCCYGAMYARRFLGPRAVSVAGAADTLVYDWSEVNDNGVVLVRYPDAMAILEGTWSTLDHGGVRGPILIGTEGTLVAAVRDGVRGVWLRRGDKAEPEFVAAEPHPDGVHALAKHFLRCLETGEPLHETLTPEFNLDVQAILEAGLRSSKTGQVVRLPLEA